MHVVGLEHGHLLPVHCPVYSVLSPDSSPEIDAQGERKPHPDRRQFHAVWVLVTDERVTDTQVALTRREVNPQGVWTEALALLRSMIPVDIVFLVFALSSIEFYRRRVFSRTPILDTYLAVRAAFRRSLPA